MHLSPSIHDRDASLVACLIQIKQWSFLQHLRTKNSTNTWLGFNGIGYFHPNKNNADET
jgi:hypothetical protein